MNGCNNCAKRRDIQKECPWGGRYLHHVEHGEGIGICGAYRKEKNADRVRAMSDEELARDRVYSTTFEDGRVLWYGDFEGYCISDEMAVKLELLWLQQPAPEEVEKV